MWSLCTYNCTYNCTYTGTYNCTYNCSYNCSYYSSGVGSRDLLYPEMATNQIRPQPCRPDFNLLRGAGGRV